MSNEIGRTLPFNSVESKQYKEQIIYIKQNLDKIEKLINDNDEIKLLILRSVFLYTYILMEEAIEYLVNSYHEIKEYNLSQVFDMVVDESEIISITKMINHQGITMKNIKRLEEFVIKKREVKIKSISDLEKHLKLIGIDVFYLERSGKKNNFSIYMEIDNLKKTRDKFAHESRIDYNFELLKKDVDTIEAICIEIDNKINNKIV